MNDKSQGNAQKSVPQIVANFPSPLWIDQPKDSDWACVTEEYKGPVEDMIRDGYCILEKAIPLDVVDRLLNRINEINEVGAPEVYLQKPGSAANLPVTPRSLEKNVRLVDVHASMPEALETILSKKIVEFTRVVFGEKPTLMQTLYFPYGSEQPIHQDTAYVVVNKPLAMVAAWIALQDIDEGSGALEVVPGSHRMGHYLFDGKRKNWRFDVEGTGAGDGWFSWMYSQFQKLGLTKKKALLKKGDVLFWHADLAHGGGEITKPEVTRHSLVGHFCPASCLPVTKYSGVVQLANIDIRSSEYDVSNPEVLKFLK